jgi:hypothetical protein
LSSSQASAQGRGTFCWFCNLVRKERQYEIVVMDLDTSKASQIQRYKGSKYRGLPIV